MKKTFEFIQCDCGTGDGISCKSCCRKCCFCGWCNNALRTTYFPCDEMIRDDEKNGYWVEI